MADDTIGALLDAASRRLDAASRSPRLDAELLLAAVLGKTRTHLLTWSDRRVESADIARYDALLERRILQEPVAYILGRRAFFDLSLEVTRDVLIPRPETELLVTEALRWLQDRPHARVIDIGTGSGAIALAVARHAPRATVVASDRSAAALAVARRNAMACGVHVEFVEGDLFDVLSGRVDLILCNPPYVSAEEHAALEPNVRDYEPHAALVAADDGLAVLRRLAEEAPRWLERDGAIGVEIGARQGEAVAALMKRSGFNNVRVLADLAGHDRVVWGQ